MRYLKSLNRYLYKYRVRFSLGIFFIILSNLFGVYAPQVVQQAIDLIIHQVSYFSFFRSTTLERSFAGVFSINILYFGIVVVALAVLRGFFLFCMRQTIIVMSRDIEYDQKNEIFDHYQKLHLDFFKRHDTGDLMSRITEDVSRVRMYTGPAMMYTLNLIALFLLVIYTMLRVNVTLTLYSVAPLPVLGFGIFYVNRIIQRKSEFIQRQLAKLTTVAQESYSGIRVIKSYVQESLMASYFNDEAEEYKRLTLDLAKTESWSFPLIFLLVGLSTVLTIFIGGRGVIAGKITPGTIAEFVIYVNMLTWPIASVGWTMALVQRASASQKRINEFLYTEPEIVNPVPTQAKIEGEVEFNNVQFIYPNTGIHALKGVSFRLRPGMRIAVIGRTGSGKSTLGQLLVRLYDVTSGSVLVDGKDVREWNLFDLREQIGYVPQDVFLFSDSVKNNIAFGLTEESLNESKVEHAARLASVYYDIETLPQKFETVVGERGVTLSGGQKQRISIARALIKNPKIVLFDDCLSAVDAHTEKIILGHLNEALKGKTAIIITHRIFTLLQFDLILVIEDGEIVEKGTHEQLMNKKGSYYTLYLKQQMEEPEEVVE